MSFKAVSLSTWHEFARFAMVGISNVLVSTLIFYVTFRHISPGRILIENTGPFGDQLHNLLLGFDISSIDASIASIFAYLGGMVFSFILNRSWTFRVTEYSSGQVWRFVALNLAGLILGTTLIFLFVDMMGGSYLIVWGGVISLTTVLNFTGNKYWTFASGGSTSVERQ